MNTEKMKQQMGYKHFQNYELEKMGTNYTRYHISFPDTPIGVEVMKIGEHRPRVCKHCGGKIINLVYDVHHKKKDKSASLIGSKCTNCGKNYMDFYVYSPYMDEFILENRTHILDDLILLESKGRVSEKNREIKKVDVVANLNEGYSQSSMIDEPELLMPSAKKLEHQSLTKPITGKTKMEKGYYIVDKKHKTFCSKCNAALVTATSIEYSKKGNPIKVPVRKCNNCGRLHITYGTYDTMKRQTPIECINEQEIERFASEFISKKAKRQNDGSLHNTKVRIGDTSVAKSIAAQKKYTKYCMCELRNMSMMTTFTATVEDCPKSEIITGNEKIYPVGSDMGIACLKAAANDWKDFTLNGTRYKVLRYVRYDAVFVDSYADKKKPVMTKTISNKPNISNSKEMEHIGNVDSREDIKEVYVYLKLNNYCTRNNHKIGTVTMKAHNIGNTSTVNVNVYHCFNCRKYWVNYDAMEGMFKRNIYPAFKYNVVNESWGNLKPVSELMMYGYNVREGVLSEQQRHKLLASIIDKKLMSKQAIISNIRTKIDFNGKKAGNENAKKKWQNDIEFVSQYVKGNAREIKGKLVR